MGCYPHFILPARSSRGFASTTANQNARFRLAFALAPRQRRLTGLATVSRRIIMQKARRHPSPRQKEKGQRQKKKAQAGSARCRLSALSFSFFLVPFALIRRAPTACRHVVSGSLSSPERGSSHLSLALLGTLSVAGEYLALRDGPRSFRPASTCPVLLRCQAGGLPL
jgi:hypothetical protein